MGYKLLEVTLISANGLKIVNHFGKMDVYVAISLSGSPSKKKKTPVHKSGGDCPSWDHTVSFTFNKATALDRKWAVVFEIKHHRTFGRDKPIGEVRLPVKQLLGGPDRGSISYKVRTTSGESKGELTFCCKQRDTLPPPPPAPVYWAPPPCRYPPCCRRARPSGRGGLGIFVAGLIGGAVLDQIFFN